MRGYDLVALIFAREISADLTSLVKRLDRQLDESMTRRKPQNKLGVFVILLGDDARTRQKLKELAAREGLKQVVLSTTDASSIKLSSARRKEKAPGPAIGPWGSPFYSGSG